MTRFHSGATKYLATSNGWQFRDRFALSQTTRLRMLDLAVHGGQHLTQA